MLGSSRMCKAFGGIFYREREIDNGFNGMEKMKKMIYFGSLVISWVVMLLLLAFLCLILGVIPMEFGLGYSWGRACGHLQLWVISLGIVLLLRPFVYKFIMTEQKVFKRTLPIILVIVGLVWLAMNVGARMCYEKAKQEIEWKQ